MKELLEAFQLQGVISTRWICTCQLAYTWALKKLRCLLGKEQLSSDSEDVIGKQVYSHA